MKPVFFISSTIYDLIDLRSSLKWWLEENDYIVNASEFNDFKKPLDKNSYEACLSAIDNSDYFILIIGERIGGMYDDELTITQKEYRHAYDRMLKGKLKIISFIRQTTWTTFLDTKNKIKTIKKEHSDFNTIIDSIVDKEAKIRLKFIDDVRRVKDMKEGKSPKNNWIHPFNTFKEIIEVLRNELGGFSELSFKQKRFVIQNDIKKNLKQIVSKNEGAIYPIGFLNMELFGDYTLNDEVKYITLSEQQYVNYASFYISCLQIKPFIVNRIESYFKSGFFLQYSKDVDDYISGDLNNLTSNLINIYERLNGLHKSMYDGEDNKLLRLGKKPDNSHLKVTPLEIFFALDYYDCLVNCINFSKNLYRALSGKSYFVPELKFKNRLPENMKAKKEDFVSYEELDEFLNEE
jgi:hypothetical protein